MLEKWWAKRFMCYRMILYIFFFFFIIFYFCPFNNFPGAGTLMTSMLRESHFHGSLTPSSFHLQSNATFFFFFLIMKIAQLNKIYWLDIIYKRYDSFILFLKMIMYKAKFKYLMWGSSGKLRRFNFFPGYAQELKFNELKIILWKLMQIICFYKYFFTVIRVFLNIFFKFTVHAKKNIFRMTIEPWLKKTI